MHMRIDEPGHQDPAAGVDHGDIGAAAELAAVVDDLDDPLTLDPQRRARPQRSGVGVEEPRVPDDGPGHGPPPSHPPRERRSGARAS